MKRDYKEDATYMKLMIKEVLRDLGIAADLISLEVPGILVEHVRPLITIEEKLIKLLEDMKKGV